MAAQPVAASRANLLVSVALPTLAEPDPISSQGELAARFAGAAKPRAAWRVGTEHEKIGVLADGAPVPYEGTPGIAWLFEALRSGRDWRPVVENGHVVALARADEQVTLEPGGQLEHSGAPHARLVDVVTELEAHLDELVRVSEPAGISWLGVGLRPFGRITDVPWMPKGRYAVMREYLPTRGRLAHEMMQRTATVQANLDFADEDDAARKLRAAMSATSVVTALYANSPIVDGADSGFASFRARVWLETDPDRCGLLPFVFEDGGLFARYTEWALDVPMFFVYRGGYVPADGITFRRFLRDGFRGELATMADWDLHLSTLFPEVRLRQTIEVRGADSGSRAMVFALPALWKGLLYDETATRETTRLFAHLSMAERLALREAVPRAGLAAPVPGLGTARDAARVLLAIAKDGLTRIAPDEVAFLAPLEEIARSGRTQADAVRELWRAAKGEPGRMISALRF